MLMDTTVQTAIIRYLDRKEKILALIWKLSRQMKGQNLLSSL